ncbi:MAG: L,D-transpeptidase family protein [Filomicrobium sp.]
MRLSTALFAAVVFGVSATSGLAATTNDPTGDVAEATAKSAGWTADHKLQVEILKEITARRRLSRDDAEKRQLDELGTLYAATFSKPVWLNGTAPSARVEQALEEFRRAEEWAFNPADYAFDLPAYSLSSVAEKARFEINFTLHVLKYVDHARSGRFRPTEMSLWYERAGNKADHMELLKELAKTNNVRALLVAQHPQHEGFNRLRQAYLRLKFPERFIDEPKKVVETKPKPIFLKYGKSIRRGQRHPQIAVLRKRLEVPADSPRDANLYDRELMYAINSFMRTQGWRRKYVYDNKVRKALNRNNGAEAPRKAKKIRIDDIVANMEKWRWLPRDLGDMHIWNNLPTFQTQVVKNGEVIHKERIIIGKDKTQTPVFSDTMTHVVFKPQWGVPNSIKVKSLLPRLAGGDLDVLRRRGMRIQYDKKIVSPSRYNWSRTDIRSIPIVMGAGSSNPLGNVKFMFPNHHAVYMHDTPDKHLFKSSQRKFSHGCIRVRNPVRLAEVLLGETSNWSTDMVADHLRRRAKENNRVDLDNKVQVHNVYFTVVADENGELKSLSDIYGHDKRIKQALAGRSLRLIAKNDPARLQKKEIEAIAKNRRVYASRNSRRRNNNAAEYFGVSPYALGGPAFAPSYKKPKKKKYVKYKKKKKSYSSFQINPYAPYSPFRGD